ncbi:glycoside hydrolase [Anaerosporomusa subterranea]|uniref:Glycoside hydrolase n=1 Tax=Anaerosporomusa subterranea TaxID=1794912 RepID=A0A154BTV0_ANASB|nr:NlpC/P60 family protein [Anaerosporomusa subterranea]KYZ77351.1 glycoside hydrolase [Anaerosporomusa subterranea]
MSGLRRIICVTGVVIFLWVSCEFAAAQPLLKQGMSGEDVLQMQIQLKDFGYLDGDADGIFDSRTKLAVMDFQSDSGLDADGILGEKTMLALREYKTVSANRGLIDGRRVAEVITMAKKFLGVPYAWAGASPGGFDCSGFVYYLYSKVGVHLPRMADGQFAVGSPVKRSELQPGDIVFFSTYEPGPSHCGIYLGNNQFIHASSAAGEVTVTPLSKAYYVERYLGARRVLR